MRNNQIENSAKNTEILNESNSIEPSINYDDILDNFELPICIVCGREVITYWEPLYSGIRASCKNCEINWAES
ncbi:MAG TPA: hypothetical protein VD731_07560 [Nitrosopumilaceae archaeon]|nr:hypothetical protein [Nitrosopumilaceae archaeon]